MRLDVYDIFKVQKNFCLGSEEIFSLTQLYLPLIGVDSFSLYSVLCFLDEDPHQIKKLLDIMDMDTPSYLSRALDKLQGMSLVKVLYNESKKTYAFVLGMPLNFESFLENSLLSSFLKSRIGSTEIDYIKDLKAKPKNPGFKDVTKSFDEVFKLKEANFKEPIPSFRNKVKDNLVINNPNFDYTLFTLGFDTDYLDPKIFDDEDFRNLIIKISFNYSLNEEEMREALIKTIEIGKDLKYQDVAKNARKIYSNKNKDSAAKTVFIPKKPEEYKEGLDDNTKEVLTSIENLGLVSVLEGLSGMKASDAELKMLENLSLNSGLPQEVINLMILYVNEEKEGVFPGYNYFEKIASTWKRAGIKTAKEALEYIQHPRKKSSYKKEKNVPSWVEKYNSKYKETKKEELTDEETNDALDKAKEMFGVKK